MERTVMFRRTFLGCALAVIAGSAIPFTASAANLDRLRAEGIVAERYDGFAEMRESGHPDAKRVVDKVNEERRRIYRERAQEKGVSVEQVGRVYAQQIFDKLPPGAYFLRQDGSYVRK